MYQKTFKGRKLVFSLILVSILICFSMTTFSKTIEKQQDIINSEKIADMIPKNPPSYYFSCAVDMLGDGYYLKAWPFLYFNVYDGYINIKPIFGEEIALNHGSGVLVLFIGISSGSPDLILDGRSMVCYLNT